MKRKPKYPVFWRGAFLFVLLLLHLPFGVVTAQSTEGSLQRKFERDAARLALRTLILTNDPRKDSIGMPTELWGRYSQILLTIYEKDTLAQALEKCNVHTSPVTPIDHLILIVEKGKGWASGLEKEKQGAGNESINRLVKRHNLRLSLVHWDDENDAVIINSEQPINIPALATTLQKLVKGEAKESGSSLELGSDITLKKIKDGWEVTYLYGFGSPLDDAKKEHFWIFHCSSKMEVEFVGEGGDEVPAWSPCPKSRH